jgi:hypothetical protein
VTSAQPDRDVASFIASGANPPSGFTPSYLPNASGGNIYASLVLPASTDGNEGGVPSQAVFVAVTGGPPPTPYAGQGASLSDYRIQVRVRGNTGDQQGPLAIARWVQGILHTATISCAATGGNYAGCWALQSDPLPLGADGNGAYDYSLNFRLPLATVP